MRRKDREIKEQSEIFDILKKCKVCRIAMIDNNRPYIVPMNYGFSMYNDNLTIYFHCAKEGRKIDILRANPYVCFEMDVEGELEKIEDPCDSGYLYESIIGYANAEIITEETKKCEALTNIVKHQTGRSFEFTPEQAKTVHILKLVATEYTGKKKIKSK